MWRRVLFYTGIAAFIVSPALAQIPTAVPSAAPAVAPSVLPSAAPPAQAPRNPYAPQLTVPVPQAPAAPSSSSMGIAPIQPPAYDPFKDPDRTQPPEDAAYEAKNAAYHEKENAQDTALGGFKWTPWMKAGDKVIGFIKERDPTLEHAPGNFYRMDISVADLDHDALPDIIVYDWTDCVADGCQYSIYFGNKQKTPRDFFGHVIRPYEKGISIDDGYYRL